MKAIVLHEFGDASQLKYEDAPDPKPGVDEVLVRQAATSINPVDFKIRTGALQKYMPIELPAILGRDIAGTVEAVGSGVTNFVPGDRVMALGNKSYAELVVVSEASVALIPDGLDAVEAAVLPLVSLTGSQLVTLGVQPQQGQIVLVTGAVGAVGRAAVFTAKQAGAKVIAGVRGSQREEAQGLGASEVVAIDDDAAIANLPPLDAVADTVGHEAAEKLLRRVKPGGAFASVVGAPANAAERADVRIAPIRVKPDAPALGKLAEEFAAGGFKIPVSRRLPLAQAAAGQALVEKGGVGKVLLLVEKPRV